MVTTQTSRGLMKIFWLNSMSTLACYIRRYLPSWGAGTVSKLPKMSPRILGSQHGITGIGLIRLRGIFTVGWSPLTVCVALIWCALGAEERVGTVERHT